LIAQN